MSSLKRNKFPTWLPTGFFIIIVLASIADIIADIRMGSQMTHIIQEAIILGLAAIMLFYLIKDIIRHRKANRHLTSRLTQMDKHCAELSKELIYAKKEFGEAITSQLQDWRLTGSETDVTWLILKGYNSKQIAQVKNLSEKTIRNQLSSVYKKSGLQGKHALIAWFMDDLL